MKFDSVIDSLDAEWAQFMDPEQEDEQRREWQEHFFSVVRRKILKPLSGEQVNGIKTMLFIWKKFFHDQPWEFFCDTAGQAVRETGGKMDAIRETYATSQKQAVARLDKFWNSGKARRFGVRKPYWRHDGTGYPFGRGIIQLTLRDNYTKAERMLREEYGIIVDLDGDYKLALDPLVSALVAFGGMQQGLFRGGRKQANYLSGGGYNYYDARDIVNGDKGKVGREIEYDSLAFAEAVSLANKKAGPFLSLPIAYSPVEDEPSQIEPVIDLLPVDELRNRLEANYPNATEQDRQTAEMNAVGFLWAIAQMQNSEPAQFGAVIDVQKLPRLQTPSSTGEKGNRMNSLVMKFIGPRVQGIARHLLTTFGGFLMANGYADASLVDEFTGGALTMIGLLWSALSGEKVNFNQAKMLGFARHALTILAGVIAAQNTAAGAVAMQLVPIAVAGVGFLFSYLAPEKAK